MTASSENRCLVVSHAKTEPRNDGKSGTGVETEQGGELREDRVAGGNKI